MTTYEDDTRYRRRFGSKYSMLTYEERRALMSTGSQLRKLRETSGWTQRDLAVKIGCSQPHLCNVERGRSTPSEQMTAKIKKVCANGKAHVKSNGLGALKRKSPKRAAKRAAKRAKKARR